jgi:hypothetical protein
LLDSATRIGLLERKKLTGGNREKLTMKFSSVGRMQLLELATDADSSSTAE